MSTRILVAKHIADYRRNEPRNVGVIVAGEASCAARFLGEDQAGKVDGRRAKRVVGGITDVYREWVAFWREALEQGAEDLSALLNERAPNFYIEDAAEVWDDENHEPAALLEHYYDILVGEAVQAASDPTLKQRVDTLLEDAGVTDLPGFRRNHELAAEGFTRPLPLRFPYARENGQLTVADRADLDDTRQTSSLLFGFEHAPAHAAKIAFYTASDLTRDEAHSFLEVLDSLARIIDIDEDSAGEETFAAFG